jgi:hypothetical protein
LNKFTNLFFNLLVTKKKYFLLLIIEVLYFALSYYIVSPSNFNSFSDTLRYYISALGTLLAVVVSFNTVALQNQLKNLPTNIKLLDSQLNRVETMIKPILSLNKDSIKWNNNTDSKEKSNNNNKKSSLFDNVTRYYPDALKNMIILVNESAQHITNKKKESERVKHFQNICKDVSSECENQLKNFRKSGSPFDLVKIDTTRFVVRLTLTLDNNDDDSKNFHNLIKNLHILRNISSKIYLRNLLSNLTYELLTVTIPIIAFIGVISSISNYENYNITLLRILFGISISVAIMPFIILFIRTIPLVNMIKDLSSIPFASKGQ